MKTLWLIALVGCAASQEELDPAELAPGIYQLRVETQQDDCTPHALAGDLGALAIAATASGIPVADVRELPEGRDVQWYSLAADAGYLDRNGPGIIAVNQCAGPVTFVATRLLMSVTARAFVVNVTKDFTVETPCDAPARDGFPVPNTSCHTEQVQTYELVTACRAPCELRATTSASTCECPIAATR